MLTVWILVGIFSFIALSLIGIIGSYILFVLCFTPFFLFGKIMGTQSFYILKNNEIEPKSPLTGKNRTLERNYGNHEWVAQRYGGNNGEVGFSNSEE